jgi:MHS family dicarboxylic acid transporter PcaT-like MFS transporter
MSTAPASVAPAPNTPYTTGEIRHRIFSIVAASSGNLVEWFDFYVHAFTSLYFAPAFFPKPDPTAQLLNTAGVFAAGFLMRPIGGWLFGRIADRKGRRISMVISVTMMCGPLIGKNLKNSTAELVMTVRDGSGYCVG